MSHALAIHVSIQIMGCGGFKSLMQPNYGRDWHIHLIRAVDCITSALIIATLA